LQGKGDRVVELLRSVSIFKGLNDKQLKSLAEAGKESSFAQGATIIEEGEPGVGFYMILSGSVEVRRGGKALAKLSAGNFFGEMTLLDNMRRSADVVATAPATCFVLSGWSFAGIIRSDPEIALGLLKEMVKRLRGTDDSPV
jgi:CRP/FNR family transcriptional regulator, cyclic AMP receptor protein